jgi:FixJ family two-component response regulator
MATGKVIAVIDDDETILHAMGYLLSALGFQTELYGSAEAFIAAATRSAAACLLVDIQLGDLTGIELTRHLSAMGFTFPIIFMTGSDDRLFRKQAIEIGCVAYLSKPIPPERLKAAIAEAIGSNPVPGSQLSYCLSSR